MADLAFLKDKRFQLAAGGGVVLGAVVLLRKGSGGGGSTSSTTGTAGGLGTFSDSGMSAYQNLNDELNAGIQNYADQLGSLQDQLNHLKPAPSTSGGGTKKPPPHPAPTPKPPKKGGKVPHRPGRKPPAAPGAKWYTVRRGDTLTKIASRNHESLSHLEKLNRGIKNPNVIKPGQRVRTR